MTAFAPPGISQGRADGRYANIKTLRRRDLKGAAGLPIVMPNPAGFALSASGASSSISSAQFIPCNQPDAFSFGQLTPLQGVSSFVYFTMSGLYTQGTTDPGWFIDFEFDTADATGRFEISMRGQNAPIRVLVNDNYVTPGATFYPPSDGGTYLGLVTLGAPGTYRIRLECNSTVRFYGLNIAPTDTVRAVRHNRLLLAALGDSVTEPTIIDSRTVTDGGTTSGSPTVATAGSNALDIGAKFSGTGIQANSIETAIGSGSVTLSRNATANGSNITLTIDKGGVAGDGWFTRFGYMLGCDTVTCAAGGTGYLNPGTHGTIRTRLPDLFALPTPDIIFALGGQNDYANYTAAAIGAEALLVFQAIRAHYPNTPIVVLSAGRQRGWQTFPVNLLATADALKAAAAQVTNTVFLDLLRLPATRQPAATTLQADAAAGVTSVSLGVLYPDKTYFQIGTGSNAEIRRVNGTPTGTGPYTTGFSGADIGGSVLANNHTAGETVQPVGPSYQTGRGTQAAPTGIGNSDRYAGSDGVHPTRLGHDNIARIVYSLYAPTLVA